VRVRDASLELPGSRIEIGDSTIVVREAGSVHEADVSPLPNFGSIYGVSTRWSPRPSAAWSRGTGG
jgi:hypothetical protein